MEVETFQRVIRSWYRRNGRHDLPWRRTHNPYNILVSEVMLQQTQVSRVIPKYREFLAAFPTIQALHRAPLSSVLRVWQGMGYNRRALYLKRLADIVVRSCKGSIPSDPEALTKLPAVGKATAGAIAAFAFGKRVAFLETNIRRVYLDRFFKHRRRVRDADILATIKETLPRRGIRAWYYALMDYGALAFGRIRNPNRRSAHYARPKPFKGSRRELRGTILRVVVSGTPLTPDGLRTHLRPRHRHTLHFRRTIRNTVDQLIREGLIEKRHGHITPAHGTRAQ